MKLFADRRVVIAAGLASIVLLAILVALFLKGRGGGDPGMGGQGLQLELGKPDPKTEGKTEAVRCFVDGKLVGMTTLAECAQKNGTASQALDVGLDQAPGASNTVAPAAAPTAAQAATTPAQTAECLRYGAEGWKGYGSPLGLSACVRVLFQGQCARPGEALYGRWGGQSLRLVPGRVEISDDNRRFRPLVDQDPQDCSIPAM